MKKKLLFCSIFLGLCALWSCKQELTSDLPIITIPNSTHADDTVSMPDYMFDINDLPIITISVTKANWNHYLQNFDENANNRQHVHASFTMEKGDGNIFYRNDIGLRPRGNTSRIRPEGSNGMMHDSINPQWHHAHFGINFVKYYTGKPLWGSDHIVLKWFNGDPAYCREIYAYDLFKRFDVWSAPRACYCRLYIHVEGDAQPAYFGVYVMLEGVNESYLQERYKQGHFPDVDGNLWKAGYSLQGQADLFNPDENRMGVADGWSTFTYNLKTNKKHLEKAKTQLANFMRKMSELPYGSGELKKWLEEHIDIDLYLRQLAVSVTVGMWDDYWIWGNNFYFYFDSQGKFYYIPYDYDQCLGTGCIIDTGKQDPLHWGERTDDRQLVAKVLSIPEFEDKYLMYLKKLASSDELFGKTGSQTRIKKWYYNINQYIINDTGEDMYLNDVPAEWTTQPLYRLLKSSEGINFFDTKIHTIDSIYSARFVQK